MAAAVLLALLQRRIPKLLEAPKLPSRSHGQGFALLYIDNILLLRWGSIMFCDWINDAAICMDGAGYVEVVAGAHDLTVNEDSQVSLTSTDFFIHEDYSSLLIHNDIAMIQLPSSLTFNDYIQPICLPSGSDLGVGVDVTPTGWGKDTDGIGSTTDTLNQVTVPTMSNDECTDYYGSLIVTDDMICIDTTGGMGTCSVSF
ncbi:UNVERIFIED_CONTAM: hypothetical protein GTU68_005541 [Idotea baltica]|nr:hypothetical protein [Idotea baltica]